METPGPDPESILVPPETTILEVEPPTSLVEYTETVERLCKQLDPIGQNCVAFCVADGLDPLLSRVKPRLFGSCPRHFLHAGRAIHGPCRLFFARHPAAGQFW